MKFNWKRFVLVTAACWLLLVTCACTPAWATEVTNIAGLIQGGISIILGLLAGLGKTIPATVTTAITDVETTFNNELPNISTWLADYEKNADATVLGKVKAFFQATSDGLVGFVTGLTGVSDAAKNRISSLVQVLITAAAGVIAVVPVIGALTPALSTASPEALDHLNKTSAAEGKSGVAMARETFNFFLNIPSGDPDLDAAMAKAPRL